ncbi:Ig-like domain-containing protein [Paenibacillus kobensis]|uniref:Ig-like domain-containing protein n=1 Tax=Paenibacillus kobensis TaxID=59841 RepID=UPI000FD7DDB7|nr:Ig-like domain-containing protein [Paenibacillus kobensis]
MVTRRAVISILAGILIFYLGGFERPALAEQTGNETKQLPRIAAISSGLNHVLAVAENGTLWAWGDNSNGQLGDGNFVSRAVPVQVGSGNDWAAAAAGYHFSIGIKKDGSLWMWGTNEKQQHSYPQNAVVNQKVPLRYGKDSNWIKVSAGNSGAAAVRKDGTIEVFGLNVLPGEVIDRGKLNKDKDWADVSVEGDCLLALKSSGSLWAYGRCTPSSAVQLDQVTRIGDDNDWQQIAASTYPTALKKDGSVWELRDGDGAEKGTVIARSILDLPHAIYAAGNFVTAIVGEDGSVWEWDTVYDRYEQIETGGVLMKQADGGNGFGVALSRDGIPFTYGDNSVGQRGNGESDSVYTPIRMDSSFQMQVKRGFTTYTLHQDGTIGMLNSWDKEETLFPGKDWNSIAAGSEELYALKKDGSLWIYHTTINHTTNQNKVLKPYQPGTYWRSVQVSDLGFAVGMQKNGSLWAWGRDGWGCIVARASSYEDFADPVPLGEEHDWQSFSVSVGHILAIKNDGTLWGMGDNRHVQIASTLKQQVKSFTKIGNSQDWAQVQTAETTTFALRKDGTLWQWGGGFTGFIAGPTIAQLDKDKDWTRIWATGQRAFALKRDGSLWTWGDNSYGSLGIGSAERRDEPVRVSELGPWAAVYPQSNYTIGVKQDGSFWKWGTTSDVMYKLDGKADYRMMPVQTGQKLQAPAATPFVSFVTFSLKDAVAKVTTLPRTRVTILKGIVLIAEGYSDSAGIFQFKLPKVKDGIYSAQVAGVDGKTVITAKYTIGDTMPPASPKVNKPLALSTEVKGTAEPSSTVMVIRLSGVYQAKADSNGAFLVKVPPLTAGEQLSVFATDAAGNRSKESKVTVAPAKK